MTATFQIFLPQQSTETIPELPEDSALSFGTFPQDHLRDLTTEELSALCEQTEADYIGFLDAPLTEAGQLNQLAAANIDPAQTSLVLCPFEGADLFVQAWETLTPWAAALALNPFEHAVVLIRKADLLSLQNLTPSRDLLWQALIRLVQTGLNCQLADTRIDVADYHGFPQTLPELAPAEPGSERDWLYSLLQAWQPTEDLETITSRPDATAVKAGLLCIHDYLDESHQFSQSVQHDGRHRAGDYWHHIMHRREPDYSNAKYWSRAVGYHPLLDELPDMVAPLFEQFQSSQVLDWQTPLVSSGRWSLNDFVDCCAECAASGDSELNEFAKQAQWIEMQLLLQRTSLDATTG
ncbi:hypothetical protein Pan153_12880 [Gimesia panareensis]|uniref:Uncharacterized protein n=1 Tax=Gimesia panareensis TaxID=2527978 RepID=A0A518FJZ6_9PLAN|nr:hypothetical protein [Gimesia panareensis]QDV16657.1 hypothetical protein Pan153_12880 [Gimesia panareensis]